MRKIVGKRIYDTSNSRIIISLDNGFPLSDERHICWAIYLTPSERWFLYIHAGSLTKLSEIQQNKSVGTESIDILTKNEILPYFKDSERMDLIKKFFPKSYNNIRNKERKKRKREKHKKLFRELIAGEILLYNNNFYCPICNNIFREISYFRTVFRANKIIWLANMVTHTRHNHIKYWDKWWSDFSVDIDKYTEREKNYQIEKKRVNERAKRHIIRNCSDFLIKQKFTVDDFMKLQHTDFHTMELATQKLNPQHNEKKN